VVIDDFAISPIGPRERNDPRTLDDRVGNLPPSPASFPRTGTAHRRPTLADAILDRLLHNAHKIHLEGKESMRKHAASDHHRAASKSKKID
jgi:DNA replication protein DnaC